MCYEVASCSVLTHVNADFSTGSGETDIVGHRHVNAIDPGGIEEVTKHQLAFLGWLHHVALSVKGPEAVCVQNHTAHLFWKAGDTICKKNIFNV